jgi:TetR/AcrR family fatty acid metabolism transcriptional regulator
MDRFISEGVLKLENGKEPAEQIAEVVALHLKLVGEDHDLAVILQIELRHSIQFMGMFSRSRLREYFEVLASIVAKGQKSGAFRKELDPLLSAKLIFGVLDQVATDWILADSNSKLSSRVDEISEFLISGLK